ncbi:hypothetical protein GGD61_007491 [Bradyrhizobium sp. SBR1B]|nr:hypothetical protein [Bradyrhizobium sp. SBR1B]
MAGRAYGKTVWSWPSLLRSSPCEGASEPNRADCIIQIRGAREARRNGRLPGDHGISRPTTAQGRPSDRHHLYAAVRFFCVCLLRSGPRVRASTRPSLRPLGFRGSRDQAKLGRIAPRDREGVSASRAACHKLDLVRWAKRSVPTPCRLWTEIVGTALCAFAHPTALPLGYALEHRNDMWRQHAPQSALVPRTQRSVPGDAKHRPVRCAAEPGPIHPRRTVSPSGSELCAAAARSAAACPGHG